MNTIIKYFPYVALAARYDEDSGDNDRYFNDYIDDTIKKWNPDAKITKIWDGIDFTYTLEFDNTLHIFNLGTENKHGWRSNFSPGIFGATFKDGHHEGWWNAGKRMFNELKYKIKQYDNIIIAGHSRGGPRSLVEAELITTKIGITPYVITYCSPPLHTTSGAVLYNSLGIPTVGVVTYRDIVDNAGEPILKHVGIRIKLPFSRNILNSIPIIGWLVGGHAYSSVYGGLLKYAKKRKLFKEIKYLKSRKHVCKI